MWMPFYKRILAHNIKKAFSKSNGRIYGEKFPAPVEIIEKRARTQRVRLPDGNIITVKNRRIQQEDGKFFVSVSKRA